jgi:hypothetical protein
MFVKEKIIESNTNVLYKQLKKGIQREMRLSRSISVNFSFNTIKTGNTHPRDIISTF